MRIYLLLILAIASHGLISAERPNNESLIDSDSLSVVKANVLSDIDRCLEADPSSRESANAFHKSLEINNIRNAKIVAGNLMQQNKNEWAPYVLVAECDIISGEYESAIYHITEASQFCSDKELVSQLLRVRTLCQHLRQVDFLLRSIADQSNFALPHADNFADVYASGPDGSNGLLFDRQNLSLVGTLDSTFVEGDFHFKNIATVPILINTIKPSCGCTTAELDKKTYLPGETGSLHIVFTTEERFGHQEKHISVGTNLSAANTDLAISVELPKAGLLLDTNILTWDMRAILDEKIVHLTATGDVPFTITEINYDKARFQVRLDKNANGYAVSITPLSTDVATTAVLDLHTNHARIMHIFCKIGNN